MLACACARATLTSSAAAASLARDVLSHDSMPRPRTLPSTSTATPFHASNPRPALLGMCNIHTYSMHYKIHTKIKYQSVDATSLKAHMPVGTIKGNIELTDKANLYTKSSLTIVGSLTVGTRKLIPRSFDSSQTRLLPFQICRSRSLQYFSGL
jgi:hypothetical protein